MAWKDGLILFLIFKKPLYYGGWGEGRGPENTSSILGREGEGTLFPSSILYMYAHSNITLRSIQ